MSLAKAAAENLEFRISSNKRRDHKLYPQRYLCRMFLIIGLLQIVWMNFHGLVAKGHFPQGFAEFSQAEKLGMNYDGGRTWRLADLYRFPALRPRAAVSGVFGDREARVVRLERRGNKLCWESALRPRAESTIASCAECETSRRETRESAWRSKSVAYAAGAARK